MELRWLPKLLLWGMLTLSCLGAVGTLLRTETDPAPDLLARTAEQQMAIETALGFTREWMHWDREELPEARMQRMKAYVQPDALARLAALQAGATGRSQQVEATEFLSVKNGGGPHFRVHVRVIVLIPERTIWEVAVPVWAQAARGAAVADPPTIQPLREPAVVPDRQVQNEAAPTATKERMRPVLESFLKAMCEGREASNLSNYVTAEARLTPLDGRLRFVSLERLEATGTGPYNVAVSFTAEDAATGFRWPQVWRLTITEENQKFFVASVE